MLASAVFQRGDLGQADDAVLGRDIGRLERRRDEPVCRSDVDDAAELVLAHRRQRRARGMERRRKIDGQDRVPLLDRKLLERRDVLDAGVVHQNIEAAEVIQRHGDHVGDRRGLRHVGRRIAHLDAELRNDLGLRFGDVFRLAEAVEHDRGACCCERASNAEPDAAGRAGDERHVALQRAGALFEAKRRLDVHGLTLSVACWRSVPSLSRTCTVEGSAGNAGWLKRR